MKSNRTRAWQDAGALSIKSSSDSATVHGLSGSLHAAVARTTEHLLGRQHPDGYWIGELEGDSILESEYILLLAYLGRQQSDVARRMARYVLARQLPAGGWAIYPGGPIDVSATAKAYFALKLTGHDPHSPELRRAREAVLRLGGAERANSFTRYYFALLGQIPYDWCPAVPPEMVLLPPWLPFNIYEMSAWTRTIVVPLSILWAYKPVRSLPSEQGISELFARSRPDSRTASRPLPPRAPGHPTQRRALSWDQIFLWIDAGLKQMERWRVRPWRRRGIEAAARWMLRRLQDSEGLGAIFPPMVWSVVALRCLGYPESSPEVRRALAHLEGLLLRDDQKHTARVQPCLSPVWDTALTTLALREAGVPPEQPELVRAVGWLLSKEVRRTGDWAVRNPDTEPGGWFFEFANAFYPDVDDTAMVLMALDRCVSSLLAQQPDGNGRVGSAGGNGRESAAKRAAADVRRSTLPPLSAVWSGRARGLESALPSVKALHRITAAKDRALRWLLAMQNRDGGWGAFDRDIARDALTHVPFADHNAMLDPSAADLTGRVLETLGRLGMRTGCHTVDKAVGFLLRTQEPDGSWYGRWGVNYIYGTWQSVVGLRSVGIGADHQSVVRGARWLLSCQQSCGGWGESCRSYDDPRWKGRGEPTASQTAWAILALLAAGEDQNQAVERGVRYLLGTQQPDGTWHEPQYTGTGFPRVFYLKYHLYCVYFPLMALARYAAFRGAASPRSGQSV